jgi:hypothetical protein
VHARGRDTRPDGSAGTPVEHYLITSWPAEAQPDMPFKYVDLYGAEVRRRQIVS